MLFFFFYFFFLLFLIRNSKPYKILHFFHFLKESTSLKVTLKLPLKINLNRTGVKLKGFIFIFNQSDHVQLRWSALSSDFYTCSISLIRFTFFRQ